MLASSVGSELRELSRKRADDRTVDLSDGAEVIREMGDAGDDAVQLHLVVVAAGLQAFEPRARLDPEVPPQRRPLLVVDDGATPAGRPVRGCPWIGLSPAPPIHQRQTVANVTGPCSHS